MNNNTAAHVVMGVGIGIILCALFLSPDVSADDREVNSSLFLEENVTVDLGNLTRGSLRSELQEVILMPDSVVVKVLCYTDRRYSMYVLESYESIWSVLSLSGSYSLHDSMVVAAEQTCDTKWEEKYG